MANTIIKMQVMRFTFLIMILQLLIYSCTTRTNYSNQEYPTEDCEFIRKVMDSLDLMTCREYYETGELRREGKYIGKIPVDWHKFYKKTGILETEIEYVFFKDKSTSMINQIISLDSIGDTIKKHSNFFIINVEKDTILLGETFYAEIELKTPYWENSRIEFVFRIPDDPLNNRHIFTGNRTCIYDYKPIDTGVFYLDMTLIESIFDTTTVSIDSMITESQRVMYLNYEYYVKEK